MINTAELMKGLDARSAALGIDRADLVALGAVLILLAPEEQVMKALARIEVKPRCR